MSQTLPRGTPMLGLLISFELSYHLSRKETKPHIEPKSNTNVVASATQAFSCLSGNRKYESLKQWTPFYDRTHTSKCSWSKDFI